MKSYIKFIDGLDWIVKLILCIPFLNILWAVYRICKGVVKENPILLIIGILWIIPGAAFLWAVDLVGLILNKKPWLVD